MPTVAESMIAAIFVCYIVIFAFFIESADEEGKDGDLGDKVATVGIGMLTYVGLISSMR